ncbi:transposase [Komagataeibacter diospyri]|uniref:transposase n=1 Tax=Komagataeibacter diospyri TaxID=1932662 RepID=UPI0011447E13|nr:transposase [Komagataeibacter diospyri]
MTPIPHRKTRRAGDHTGYPPRKNRICPRKTRFSIYEKRNIIERFFVRLKQFRGIATRYDKLKSTFCAAVQLVSAIIESN